MNPTPTPTLEPILSLPVSTAVLGVLLIVSNGTLIALLLAQRRHGAAPLWPGLGDVPWLSTLLDGLAQAALVVDAGRTRSHGYPVAWNATAASTLAWTDQEGELPPSLAALAARTRDAGVTVATEIAISDHPLRATASPLKAMGHTFGILVLIHDPAEAAQSAESYRRLIGAVAHELRTPLTAILGHADILGSWDPRQEEALWRRSRDFIASETERLSRMVEDLLTLSRLDLSPLQRQPVNLRAVAEEATSALFQAAQARGVRISLQSPSHLPRVLGDRDRLCQVFLNLLDNAVKYASANGEAVVCLWSEGGLVQVEVRDDGAGIAPEDLPYIFDPFYRSAAVRDAPGTGLGLAIVRTILEQHGTEIGVQSAPGQGTAFRFALPHAHSSASLPRASRPGAALQ